MLYSGINQGRKEDHREDETVEHFLMEWPAQSSLRRAIRDKINLLKLSSMLSNTASVELIYQWIYNNRRNLTIYHIMNFCCCCLCCGFYLLSSSLLSYSSRYAEDINKILLLLLFYRYFHSNWEFLLKYICQARVRSMQTIL